MMTFAVCSERVRRLTSFNQVLTGKAFTHVSNGIPDSAWTTAQLEVGLTPTDPPRYAHHMHLIERKVPSSSRNECSSMKFALRGKSYNFF
jgi:hypothetical protein